MNFVRSKIYTIMLQRWKGLGNLSFGKDAILFENIRTQSWHHSLSPFQATTNIILKGVSKKLTSVDVRASILNWFSFLRPIDIKSDFSNIIYYNGSKFYLLIKFWKFLAGINHFLRTPLIYTLIQGVSEKVSLSFSAN